MNARVARCWLIALAGGLALLLWLAWHLDPPLGAPIPLLGQQRYLP